MVSEGPQDRKSQISALIAELPNIDPAIAAGATPEYELPFLLKMADIQLRKRGMNPSDFLSEIELVIGKTYSYIPTEKSAEISALDDLEQVREQAYKELAEAGFNADEFFLRAGLIPPQNKTRPFTPEVSLEEIEAIILEVKDIILKTIILNLTSPRPEFKDTTDANGLKEPVEDSLSNVDRETLTQRVLELARTPAQVTYITRTLICKAAEKLSDQRMPERSDLFRKGRRLKPEERAEKEQEIERRVEIRKTLEKEAIEEITQSTKQDPKYFRTKIQELLAVEVL